MSKIKHRYPFYTEVSLKCSRLVANEYSTSFSLGTFFLGPNIRMPIYAIYGFVRFADEIVDTFHEENKAALLDEFVNDTYKAINDKISLNPILHAFQEVVNQYQIEHELIDTFIDSMRMDLDKKAYTDESYKKYILGSAEVVGLMCLRVFVHGDEALYQMHKPYGMSLGSAFQKINFLRDLKADYKGMGRVYFPGIDITKFDDKVKKEIEKDIKQDFDNALIGIKQLKGGVRLGVYIAYAYYIALFNKIAKTPASIILEKRIRVSNLQKYFILIGSVVKHKLGWIS